MASKKAKVTRRAAPARARVSRPAAPAMVQLIVNGQSRGTVNPFGLSISQAANNLAKDNGIKSYSVLLDGGMKVGTEDAAQPLEGHVSLEVFAKETRGSI